MRKGKIVDIFSGKPMDTIHQNTEENDRLVQENGKYVGHIHKNIAKVFRDRMRLLDAKSDQIDRLVEEWEQLVQHHTRELANLFVMLDVDPGTFNPEHHGVMISEDGHVWIVDLPKSGDVR